MVHPHSLWRAAPTRPDGEKASSSPSDKQNDTAPARKWNLGILSDPHTDEVPGKSDRTFLLLAKLTKSQVRSSSSPKLITVTNRWVFAMPRPEHQPRRSPRPTGPRHEQHRTLLASLHALAHCMQKRNAQKMAASSWIHNQRTQPTTL